MIKYLFVFILMLSANICSSTTPKIKIMISAVEVDFKVGNEFIRKNISKDEKCSHGSNNGNWS